VVVWCTPTARLEFDLNLWCGGVDATVRHRCSGLRCRGQHRSRGAMQVGTEMGQWGRPMGRGAHCENGGKGKRGEVGLAR
jgi:hypothetical protein